MLFTSQLTTFAAITGISLAVIPVVRSAQIDVVVGGAGVLKFQPEFVNANTGDVVTFSFRQKNHTATQSTLESPCTPAQGGFDSGFVPVADTVTDGFPVAQLTVTNTNPTWVYCRQGNHCQQGMVFAINPADKFAAFQAAAKGGNATTASASAAATSTAPAAAPTTSSTTDHKVVVGGPGQLIYNPSNITAQVGDTVTFEFRQKNHTVTASSFAAPCRALSLTSTSGQVGFDSGFLAVADGATTFPQYTIQVNSTEPIWAYCRQGNHCGQGMVFSVNAVETGPNTFAAFQAKAKELNGTAAANPSSSATAATPSPSNGAMSVRGAGIAIALVGVVMGVLL